MARVAREYFCTISIRLNKLAVCEMPRLRSPNSGEGVNLVAATFHRRNRRRLQKRFSLSGNLENARSVIQA